ncbi:MAG: hypothetical protein VX278_09115 [Myxococcota bacterium]|nr:hypothetical protein [Myxococcota bacterium]
MILFLLACAADEADINISINGETQDEEQEVESEPESEPAEEISPSGDANYDLSLCEDAPIVTWDNWAQGMIITHCQGCHASGSPQRYGAPDSVSFDTESDAIYWSDRIWIRTVEQETMPPAGGLLEEDIYLLQVWLSCGIES